MKKRQCNKILKRCGIKLHRKLPLTPFEKRICDKVTASKLCSAIDKFRLAEFDAGTYLEEGYLERMKQVISDTATIENITGVKK